MGGLKACFLPSFFSLRSLFFFVDDVVVQPVHLVSDDDDQYYTTRVGCEGEITTAVDGCGDGELICDERR